MDGVLEGSWRKASDGQYKVLVSGSEKEVGSIVEVFARYGDVKYIVITGTNSKLKTGGYLYDFRYTRKPEYRPAVAPNTNMPNIDFSISPKVDTEEISLEELVPTGSKPLTALEGFRKERSLRRVGRRKRLTPPPCK